ncbi:hypothetical protein DFH11DRAFT_1746966 [Phellopilus nigrolimitatus]|nr:hypothetical protein DFH11DRAFT_1746966 [Phellopilus nigrolimitatus]
MLQKQFLLPTLHAVIFVSIMFNKLTLLDEIVDIPYFEANMHFPPSSSSAVQARLFILLVFSEVGILIYINTETPGIPIHIFSKSRGRFLGNLSGKRVDFSGSTVISPSSTKLIDEVAVSGRITKIQTYPERITARA